MKKSFLLILPLLAGAASPAWSQTIVRSWDVAPLGVAFVGGAEYDCVRDVCWVVDETNRLITTFTGAGVLLNQWPTPIPPGSTISSPLAIGVAVDPATGRAWIGDEGEWVYEFDPATGLPTGVSWPTTPTITDVSGVSIDPATGNIFVVNDSGRMIGEFTQAGATVRSFSVAATGTTDPDGLVYDHDTGHFFLGDDTQDRIYEVDNGGLLVASWSMAPLGISPEGLGIDRVNGHLYVGDGFITRKVYVVAGIAAAGGTCPGGGPVLAKSGTCPGPVTLSGSGLTPGSQMALLYGNAGSFTKPSGACAGLTLAISQPTLAAMLPVNGSGNATLAFNSPPAACGRTVQGVDIASCTATNALVL